MRAPVLLAVLVPGAVHAQTAAPRWSPEPFTLGASAGPMLTSSGAAYGLSLNMQRGALAASARVGWNGLRRTVPQGLTIEGGGRDRAVEAAVLLGVSRPVGRRWHASGLAGPAVVRVVHAPPCSSWLVASICLNVPEPTTSERLRPALAVEAGLHGPLRGGLGVGVRAFASVNPEEPFGGVALDLRLNPRAHRRARADVAAQR